MNAAAEAARNNPQPNGAAAARAWVPAVLWLLVIAAESSFGATATTSRLIGPLVHWLWPRLTPPQYELVHTAIRKAGHFFGYAILSLFFFRAWWAVFRPAAGAALLSWSDMLRRWSLSAASVAWASAVMVAALDEWNQSFMPGRTSSAKDVLLDSAAALCAQMLIMAVSSMRPIGINQA
jgi:VanZ family protein